jgi:2-oxoglutarate ferredoxin oxidoreductase subunit gamma
LQKVTELRIAGFGGQGVILSAIVIGKAASIVEGGYATMCQNFGPEARGGACSAQLIVSPEPVLYPYVTQLDILVVMSQEAYTKFSPELKPGGLMLIEEELVTLKNLQGNPRVFGIPSTRMAEKLGKRMVSNIVMTGFFGAVTQLVTRESLSKAVADSVPASFAELNRQAFDLGYEYGLEQLKAGPMKMEALAAK